MSTPILLYNVSADGGRTWTKQFLTAEEAAQERKMGHFADKYYTPAKKTVEVSIHLTSDKSFEVGFYESESGDSFKIFGKDTDGPELSQRIGNEILSWVSLMRDELE